jgi:hypothetical protein
MARGAAPGRSKAREWLGRYLPPEAAGTSAALLAVVASEGAGAGGAAVAAAWAETVAFYTFVTARELRDRPVRARSAATALRDVVAEFGVAEAADSIVLRPLLMYAFVARLGGLVQGVIAGKLAADVVFYALAIAAYELRLRRRP